MTVQAFAIWLIVGMGTAGVVLRPWRLPEAVWAVGGAALLVLLGLLPLSFARNGICKGLDVYLFLTGMMLLSELARHQGLFDWVAAWATRLANGSASLLFVMIYGLGIIVTVFLSNDATAVVLTPAVYAATRAAQVKEPLPYLLICAFIANAASFVLPISNPANLVVFAGGHMPLLARWIAAFGLPSLAAIIVTFAALRLTQRRTLARESLARQVKQAALPAGGRIAALAIIATAVCLISVSFLGWDLGMPTLACGLVATVLVVAITRENPVNLVREISWGVLPLVAGLFIFVEALAQTGVIALLVEHLRQLASQPDQAKWIGGIAAALAANLANNLPVGLVTASAVTNAHVPLPITGALLIGVDLGPNLSVTGSLATILWLGALRREGLNISAWKFLKVGAYVMLPALLASLAFA